MLFCITSLLALYLCSAGSVSLFGFFFFEFSRDKLSCRILRLEHIYRGISFVVRVSEIKVEKRVN